MNHLNQAIEEMAESSWKTLHALCILGYRDIPELHQQFHCLIQNILAELDADPKTSLQESQEEKHEDETLPCHR